MSKVNIPALEKACEEMADAKGRCLSCNGDEQAKASSDFYRLAWNSSEAFSELVEVAKAAKLALTGTQYNEAKNVVEIPPDMLEHLEELLAAFDFSDKPK